MIQVPKERPTSEQMVTTSLIFPKGEIRREPEGSLGELARLLTAELRTRTYLLLQVVSIYDSVRSSAPRATGLPRRQGISLAGRAVA